jgi:hypothetical protein
VFPLGRATSQQEFPHAIFYFINHIKPLSLFSCEKGDSARSAEQLIIAGKQSVRVSQQRLD